MSRLIKEEQATPQNIDPAQSGFFVFRCYAALKGDEIMAVVGDGNVRWRE